MKKIGIVLLICVCSVMFCGCTLETKDTTNNTENINKYDWELKDDANTNDFIFEFTPTK